MSLVASSMWSLDHVLSPDNHTEIVQLLSALKISAKWRHFGEMLGIAPNDLDCIDIQERGKCMESFLAVIRFMVENISGTWSTVIGVVQNINEAKARQLKTRLKRRQKEYKKSLRATKTSCERVLKALNEEAKKLIRDRGRDTKKTRQTLEDSTEELTKIIASIAQSQHTVFHHDSSDHQPQQAEVLESRLETIDRTTKLQVKIIRQAFRTQLKKIENTKIDIAVKAELDRLNKKYKTMLTKLKAEHKEKLRRLEDQLTLTLQNARKMRDSCRPPQDERTPCDKSDMVHATETLQLMSKKLNSTLELGESGAIESTSEMAETEQLLDNMQDSNSSSEVVQMVAEPTESLAEVQNTTIISSDDTHVSSTTRPNATNTLSLEERVKLLEEKQEKTNLILAAIICTGIGAGAGLVALPTVTAGIAGGAIGLVCCGVCWYFLKK